MKNLIIIFLTLSSTYAFSQKDKKETIYLLFDKNSKENCEIEDGDGNDIKIKKYRKEVDKNRYITFYICEEIFDLDKRHKIDTCSIKELDTIKFETLKSIEHKRYNRPVVFFKNAVFKIIYLIEKNENKIIKYPVIWNTDLVEY